MLIEAEHFLDNVEKIQELFRNSFNREIGKQYLIWRYLENPLQEVLVSIKCISGNIIANYSASPCHLCYRDKMFKTAVSMTTMTDPNHRKKGIFPVLARELYDYMVQDNYYLVWGFPNHQSHSIFTTHLSWYDIYEIPTMVLDLINYSDKSIIKYDLDNNFDLSYDDSIIPDRFIHVLKNKDYLKWRYSLNPINQYNNIVISSRGKVSSYLVSKTYGQCLDIVDFQAVNYDEGEYLLKAAISYSINHKLANVNCWAPINHFIHQICERQGFRNSTPITYFGVRLLNDKLNKKEFTDYSNWYIQMGDSDVY